MRKIHIFGILLVLILIGVIIYQEHRWLNYEGFILIDATDEKVDSLMKENAILQHIIERAERDKSQAREEQIHIHNHYQQYYPVIMAAGPSDQNQIQDTLLAKYRVYDSIPYFDTLRIREVNYRLAQGMEAKELVPILKREISADEVIIRNQDTIIGNQAAAITQLKESRETMKGKLQQSTEKYQKEEQRKKRWRLGAIIEGAVIATLLIIK